jgi:hypothetical protein
MIDYLDPKLVFSRFNSLVTSGYCTLVAGADQGQGAWRSWIKICTYGESEVREHREKDEMFDFKTTYSIAQVAHITCKKDNSEILQQTVSQHMTS